MIEGWVVIGAGLLGAAVYEHRRRSGRSVIAYGRWVPVIALLHGASQVVGFRPGSWIASLGIVVWGLAVAVAAARAEAPLAVTAGHR